MGLHNPSLATADQSKGFRAAIAFYPGCGKSSLYQEGYRSYGHLIVFLAQNDEEVSPQICARTLQRAKEAGSDIQFIVYNGAGHGFDDPGEMRQSVEANRRATQDAMQRSGIFFRQALER